MGYSDAYVGGYGVGSGDVLVGLYLETDPDTWVDISADLISGNTARGRQSALDQYQAGTCSVELDNDARTYDPNYAASPLNGHILPMKRLKVLGVYGGVSYPLFLGYVDRWTQNRDGPRRGTTTVQATDGFKVLERANLAASSYAQEVQADGPVAWWRFDELGGTVARDSVGDIDLAAVGSPELGTDTLISRDPGASVTTDDTTDGLLYSGQFPVTAGPLSIEVVLSVAPEAGYICGVVSYGVTAGFDLAASDAAGFEVATGAASGWAPSSVDYTDGATHHVVGTWAADGRVRIYVDGVDTTVGTPSVALGSFAQTTGYTFLAASPLAPTLGAVGVFDEFAIYDHELSAARVAAHAEAVATPWDGDTSGERIERVLDAVGWPDDLRDVDTGQTTLQSAELGVSALEHAQKVEQTENGNLYVKADGVLRFEDRNSGVNQSPVAAFSDELGGDLPITFSDPELSDEQIRNDVTVSRLEGVAQNTQDPDSIAAYQRSSYTRDGLYHDNDEHSRYLAQFILQAYKDPVERVSSMAVNPYRDPAALFPAVLALELTDRITLDETPQNTGPEVSRTVVVEGISHQFAGKSWAASFNLSENTAQTQGYWQLGTAGFSELGETTRLFL